MHADLNPEKSEAQCDKTAISSSDAICNKTFSLAHPSTPNWWYLCARCILTRGGRDCCKGDGGLYGCQKLGCGSCSALHANNVRKRYHLMRCFQICYQKRSESYSTHGLESRNQRDVSPITSHYIILHTS